MMMIVDVTAISQSFGDVAEELEQVGEAILSLIHISCRPEIVYNANYSITG